jgi:hypothetical protein
MLTNIVDTAVLSSPPTPCDRREDLEQLRQLGRREGTLNQNSLHPTQAKRDIRLTGRLRCPHPRA